MHTLPRRWLWPTLFALSLVCVLGLREYTLAADGHLHLYFFPVGQGDSALIVTPKGKQILIDGGPDWSTLEGLGHTLPFFDRTIDLLVLSHPNLDHLLSFPEMMKRYHIGGIVLSGAKNDLPRYQEIFALAREKNIPIHTVSAGQTVKIEQDVSLDVLWPPRTMPTGFSANDNNASVVLLLKNREHRALFTGDMEKPVEETLVRSSVNLSADILKVAHHGSNGSSTESFLRAVHPSIAVISVGKNSYGHPRAGAIDRLQKAGAVIRRTDKDGVVEMVW